MHRELDVFAVRIATTHEGGCLERIPGGRPVVLDHEVDLRTLGIQHSRTEKDLSRGDFLLDSDIAVQVASTVGNATKTSPEDADIRRRYLCQIQRGPVIFKIVIEYVVLTTARIGTALRIVEHDCPEGLCISRRQLSNVNTDIDTVGVAFQAGDSACGFTGLELKQGRLLSLTCTCRECQSKRRQERG